MYLKHHIYKAADKMVFEVLAAIASSQIRSKQLRKTQKHRQITVHMFYLNVNDYVTADMVFRYPVVKVTFQL